MSKIPALKVKSAIKPIRIGLNHNTNALRVTSSAKTMIRIGLNHNQNA